MFRYVLFVFLILFGATVHSHQLLPTYPSFENSFINGVVFTKMQLFNKRKEVEFYEIDVFDGEWNSLPFASESKLVQIKYLETKNINVYIRRDDLKRVVYICTESKLKSQDVQFTAISSRVCSKVK